MSEYSGFPLVAQN